MSSGAKHIVTEFELGGGRMFVLKFCDNPNDPILIPGQVSYSDTFEDEFISQSKALDKFIYLVDMYRIIESCASDLVNVSIDETEEFWKINKLLLNYVNSVYSYKEFVNSYDPPLKKITEHYYKQKKWYRFVCDYRNRVIHQSIIIKDYCPESKDIFVDLDEVIEIQEGFQFKNEHQQKNSEKFKDILEELKKESKVINGKNYLSMKYVVVCANEEIRGMKDEVLLFAFNKGVKPVLEWLISLIPIVDGNFKYAFIVNEENFPDGVYEPNYALEDFYRRMFKCLGVENLISKEIDNLFKQHKYDNFFD